MSTAVQVQYRRGTASQVASFTGAAGEMVVDTTNNRVVVQDGATAGGFPAARLSEVQTNTRTQVSDGNYTVQTTDRLIAFITLTASRTVSLPAASTYPGGSRLLVVDESGNCSASKTIMLSASGSDLIDGASTAFISTAYGYVALECNTANKWTIVDQVGMTLNGLSGAVSLAATDGAVIAASGTIVSIGGPGGMVNRFRNATMDVWQRGTAPSLTSGTSGSGYTADGWIVGFAASSAAAPGIGQGSGRLLTKSSLKVTGASYITDVYVKQRIESVIAAAFCSQTVTVQAQVYNNTGAAITPTLTVNRPSAQDSYGSTTADVNAVSLQSCANGAWTRIAYTFTANAASYNGLEIYFDFGNNFGSSSDYVQITELDIRVTPGGSAGLNANPPPPELRPVFIEVPLCQRYFWQANSLSGNYVAFGASAEVSATVANAYIKYPTKMRAAPTLNQSNTAIYDANGAHAVSGLGTVYLGDESASINISSTGLTAGNAGTWLGNNSSAAFVAASAEL